MRAVRISFLALLLCWALAALAPPVRADVAVPQLTGRVVDQTGTLGADAIARLNDKLKSLETRKGSQIAVLIVPTTQPEEIAQFSIRVAEAWKIGRKKIDDGALLLIAKNDRKLRIEVGYGLEGALNDITAKRIIDEIITPKFKAGDFAGGVADGVDKMIGVIDGEPLPKPEPQHDWSGYDGSDISGLAIPLLFGTVIVNAFLQAFLGRLTASILTGMIAGTLAFWLGVSWYLALAAGVFVFLLGMFFDFADNLMASRRSGSSSSGGGWSGDGGSSWSSGSSGSSSDSGGSFSGGGGDFGGGGASGSW
jgi:uncharacterized protein